MGLKLPMAPGSGWGIALVLTMGMVGVIVLVVAVSTMLDIRRERSVFREKEEQKGLFLATGLNDILANYIYVADVDALSDIGQLLADQPDVIDIAYFQVFNAEGRLLASTDSHNYPVGPDYDKLSLQAALTGEAVLKSNGDGLEFATPLTAGSEVIGVARYGFKTDALDAEIREIIVQHIWQGLIVIGIGLILSHLIARYATRPLRALGEAAGNIGRGSLETPVPMHGPSETRELGSSLEIMRSELQALYADLEQQVLERTQAMTETTQGLEREVAERRLAEQELRQSEARYRLIFESASDAIITFGLDHTIISMNPEAEAMTGYSQQELAGQRATVYLTPASAQLVEERMRQWLAGGKGPPTIECEGVRKDGVIVPFEGRTVFVRDNAGTPVGYQGIFRDITERKKAEAALKASTQELAGVDEVSRILTSTLDFDQVYDRFAEEMHKLVLFDRASIQVINHDSATVTLKYLSGQIRDGSYPGTSMPLAGTYTEQSIATGSSVLIHDPENVAGLRSSIVVPLASKGRVIASMALSCRQEDAYGSREQAILERMASQIAPAVENSILFAATVRLGVAVAAVGEGICITDLEGIIEFVNPALQELLGYEAADLLGLPLSKLYSGGAGSPVFQSIMAALPTGPWSGEVELLGKSGELVPTLEVATPMRESAGQVVGYVCVNTDLRERRRVEEERRSLEVKALAQSKLATIGQVATGMAHEINQPLTYINTFIQALEEDLTLQDLDPERIKGRLAESLRQVARIDGIVQHLRTFGRRGDTKMSPLSLEEVVDNTLLLLDQLLKSRNIQLERRIKTDLPWVMGNANQLEEVFINLFQNSIDAFREDQADAKIGVTISDLPDERALGVRFSDNGVGIGPGHLDRIFEPFFTTKEEGRGTGLGLSIIYGIITDHHGTITCESEYTKGTTITITLPAGGALHA